MDEGSSFLIAIPFLILSSALLSAAESALLSSSQVKINTSGHKFAKILKENEDKVLIAIVIWNNIVNILLSLLIGKFFENISGSLSLGIATAIATFLIVTFGEIIPKSLAVNLKEKFLIIIAPLIYVLYLVSKPAIFLYHKLIQVLTKKQPSKYSEEELKMILSLSLLKDLERKLVERVLALDSKTVGSILIPKDNVVMISEDKSLREAIRLITETKYSKIITYSGDRNNVTGYINLKDIAAHINNLNKKAKEVKRKILFVPEYMKVLDLIELFKKTRIPIAAVIDEYGNFLGIVTLTDALEEVFGELREVGEKSNNNIEKKGKELIVAGDTSIEELNSQYNLKLPKGESYNTVGGLIMYKLGRLPTKGEKLEIGNMLLIVEDVGDHRINKVRIIIKNNT